MKFNIQNLVNLWNKIDYHDIFSSNLNNERYV